jgi:clan AA aspartic protease (TIGR02281 family)
MRRLVPVLLLALAGAAQADPWPENCKLHRVASFPMTLHSRLVTIPVTINGQEKQFMVDTGGYASSVNREVAQALGMRLRNIIRVRIRDAGGKEATSFVKADSLRLGQMEAKDIDLMVDEANGFDGVIAPDLLRNYDVDFDFANLKLNLFQPHPCEGKAVYWPSTYAVLPMEITQDGHTRIPVTLDGKDMDAIVDSGASASVMPMSAAERFFDLKRDSANVTRRGELRGGQGSVIDAYSYPFKTLSFGTVTATNPHVLLSDTPNGLSKEHSSLVLGMTELHFLHFYLAYKEHKIYVSAAGLSAPAGN